MNQLNAYKIKWLYLIPIKGRSTNRDAKIVERMTGRSFMIYQNGEMSTHFNSTEKAELTLSKIKGLNKEYKALIITDKQFGMSNMNNSITTVATSKQLAEMVIVK